MNCQRVQETFIDYQAGTLAAAESAAVREHLKICLTCQREWAGLQETLLQLDRLPPEEPSARLRTNFYAMLDTHLRQAREPSPFALMRNRLDRFFENLVPTRPALQFAMSTVLLVAGVIVGARYLQPAAPTPQAADPRVPRAGGGRAGAAFPAGRPIRAGRSGRSSGARARRPIRRQRGCQPGNRGRFPGCVGSSWEKSESERESERGHEHERAPRIRRRVPGEV